MVGGVSFKSMLVDKNAIWVRVRELNYLIEKGIIQVDKEKLKEFAESDDPEYTRIMRDASLEADMRDLLGRKLTDVDRQFIQAGRDSLGMLGD